MKPPPTPPKEGGRETTNQQKNRPVRVKEITYISGKKYVYKWKEMTIMSIIFSIQNE